MNANELADYLDVESSQAEYGYVVDDWKLFRDAANMLRQQANRIAELEKDIALKTRDRDVFKNFTLAYEERIAELEKLVDELAGYKESYENCHRMCNGYGMN